MKSYSFKNIKKGVYIPLAVFLIMGLVLSMPAPLKAEASITFERDGDGRPIFDGNPEHLDAFVNFLMDDMTFEELIRFSDPRQFGDEQRANYALPDEAQKAPIVNTSWYGNIRPKITLEKGYDMPYFLDGSDDVYGVSTEFPASIGMGNSWNKRLASDIGKTIGDEKRGSIGLDDLARYNYSLLIWSAIGDMRANPLNGRVNESFSEDPMLTGALSDLIATNISGVNLNDGDPSNDFWVKSALQSKHFANYNTEWFRLGGSNNISARALREYQLPAFIKQISNGSVVGYMTSYGRTNGVPNPTSPNLMIARDAARYTPILFCDYSATVNYMTGKADARFSNGVDNTYVSNNEEMSALFTLAGSGKGIDGYDTSAGKPSPQQTVNGIKKGYFGVTEDDVREAARAALELYTRCGYFNELEGNTRKGYPYNDVMLAHLDYRTPEHQDIAYQASVESIVMLKNDGNVLPLAGSNRVEVSGPFADTRFKAQYSANTPSLPNAGLTPLKAIENVVGAGNVDFSTSGKIVAFKSKELGSYVSAPTAANGGALTVNAAEISGNELFELFAWGQEGYSLRSLANGRFLTQSTSAVNNSVAPTTVFFGTGSPGGRNSAVPARFRIQENDDGTVTVVGASFGSTNDGFYGTSNMNAYYSGRFWRAAAAGNLGVGTATGTGAIGNPTVDANRNDTVKFEMITVREAGEVTDAADNTDAAVGTETVADSDYAVIVVGAPTRQGGSGEGIDRSDLYLGKEQYELVNNTAARYPGRTIVIVKADFPVIMKEIQDNPNVAAILFQPYAGQYDGLALGDVLFGMAAPTGRLTSTWYADMSAMPPITEYSLPEGMTVNPYYVEPRFTVDYTNGDPAEAKLTYMYTDAEVTYPFGYGLGYSSFEYSNLYAPGVVDASGPFEVCVDVTNTGDVETSEVVQLYVSNKTSAYKQQIPKLQLASFEKVEIAPTETKTVSLVVDPKDFALWDVNSGKHTVESGIYSLIVGKSSAAADNLEQTIYVDGESLAAVRPESYINVWDHTYAANKLVYREVSKERSINYLGEYYAVMSTGPDSWAAIPNVDLKGVKLASLRVATNNPSGSVVEIHAESPDGPLLGALPFGETGINSYVVPSNDGSGGTLREIGYEEFTIELNNIDEGLCDLYLTFNQKDIRVDGIKLIYVNPVPEASIKKLNGNQNELTITVNEIYSDGGIEIITVTILINNNAAGIYDVGDYKVYVDTKGNTQVRECYIVE